MIELQGPHIKVKHLTRLGWLILSAPPLLSPGKMMPSSTSAITVVLLVAAFMTHNCVLLLQVQGRGDKGDTMVWRSHNQVITKLFPGIFSERQIIQMETKIFFCFKKLRISVLLLFVCSFVFSVGSGNYKGHGFDGGITHRPQKQETRICRNLGTIIMLLLYQATPSLTNTYSFFIL